MRPDSRDRVRGALIGLAVGDALGAAVEFMAPGSFPPLTDMRDGGPHGLRAGEWTDDTSMALCLAESLLQRGGFDAGDQMRRYLDWYRRGYLSSTGRCFDIGNATRAALHRFEADGNPFAGSPDPGQAGNGSLMRLAPVALFYRDDPAEAVRRCGESSRTTHAAPATIDACRYFGGLLVGAVRGVAKETLLSPRYTPVPALWDSEPLCPEIDAVAAGSFLHRKPPQIRGSGWVVASLEAALWAFASTDSFREGCLAAANLGEDADTTAAIFGQIGGACNGESAIPSEWRSRLALPGELDRIAEGLFEAPSRA